MVRYLKGSMINPVYRYPFKNGNRIAERSTKKRARTIRLVACARYLATGVNRS